MSFPYELIPKLHHSMLSTDEKEKVWDIAFLYNNR